jgi:hypothetical protein
MSVGFGAAGCYADAGYSAGYYGPTTAVAVAGPDMVVVDGAPGVQVVAADYDYPVFYSDNLYWRYDGGIWYSSRWHDRGWGRNYNVPVGVRGINRPEGYAHYRNSPNYRTHVEARGNAGFRQNNGNRGGNSGPVVRDHRSEPARSAPARSAPSHGPVVRDHRH